jgi:hypothetical protein
MLIVIDKQAQKACHTSKMKNGNNQIVTVSPKEMLKA